MHKSWFCIIFDLMLKTKQFKNPIQYLNIDIGIQRICFETSFKIWIRFKIANNKFFSMLNGF